MKRGNLFYAGICLFLLLSLLLSACGGKNGDLSQGIKQPTAPSDQADSPVVPDDTAEPPEGGETANPEKDTTDGEIDQDSSAAEASSADSTDDAPGVGSPDPELKELAGLWQLYSYEVEGDGGLAEENGIYQWIRFRSDGTADYGAGGPTGNTPEDWPIFLSLPVDRNEEGLLSFCYEPLDLGAITLTVTQRGPEEITVSGEWTYPDGTPGGNTCVYRLLEPEGPEFRGRALTEAELEALTGGLDYNDIGFYVCTYDRPEEIDWHQVFYNGAGMGESSPAIRDALEKLQGHELYTGVTAIPADRVEDFVWQKTQTHYRTARKPLMWDYLPEFGVYYHQHGDTNAERITFTGGYADGNRFTLYYTRSDWEHWLPERPFAIQLRWQGEAGWQYISNLPTDAPAPITLLNIEYFNTKEEAAAQRGVTRFVETQPLPSDEDSPWLWAVITAQTDNVRYIVDRADPGVEYGEFLVRVPGESLDSGVLNEGECFAVYVNQPWHPEIRIMATRDSYWGEYCFGEDNGLSLEDGDLRYVTGHDLQGEGRGADAADETGLYRFLSDGDWIYFDPNTGAAVAALSFHDYREVSLQTGDGWWGFRFDYDRFDARPTEAPDLLLLHKALSSGEDWSRIPASLGDELGAYQLYAVQMDGEQILTLTGVEEEFGALSSLLPGYGNDSFSFVRYRGTAEMEDQGG